jgi:hypothetical protein
MKNIIQRVFRALAVGYIVKAIRNLISKAFLYFDLYNLRLALLFIFTY